MRCKHNWENVVESASTDHTDPENYQILMCNKCKAVKVHYRDIKRIKIIKKPVINKGE